MNEEPGGAYRRHGHPAEGISLAALAALGLEAVLPGAGAPGWVLPAAEIAGPAASAFAAWSLTGRRAFPLYVASLGGWLGGWTYWAQASGLWTADVIGAWLAGLAASVPLGVLAWHRRRRRPGPPALTAVPEPLMIEPEPDENEVQRGLFAVMFADYGINAGNDPFGRPVPVDVYQLTEEKWGRQLRIRLPARGHVTVDDFRAKARNFEVALNAQEGAVMFESGTTSAEVVMKVRERDGLAEPALLTPAIRSRTANEPVVVGIQEDGSYLKMPVREVHVMIIGMSGSGKSNLLNVIIAQLASCVDTVIWAIDMKGGRAIAPWFQAWEEGRADRPVIDWIATDRREAAMMMNALEQAVEARMRSKIGRNKIIPSAGMPQIILVCDEMADLFGDAQGNRTDIGEDGGETNTWFIKKGNRATQKGRSEAVTTIWASQRGTTSMGGSTDMKANVDIRIALKPAQLSELQWIVPDLPPLAGRQLQYLAETPGVGMMGRGSKASQPTKIIHHDHIEGVCGADEENPVCPPQCPVYQSEVEASLVRPRLDTLTAQALGTVYAQRWVRAQRDGVLRVPVAALSGGSALHGYSGDVSRFDEVIRAAGWEDPDKDLPPVRRRLRELLPLRADGWTPKQLRDALADEFGDAEMPVRETVQKWLRADRDAGLCHHPRYRTWKHGAGPNTSDEDD